MTTTQNFPPQERWSTAFEYKGPTKRLASPQAAWKGTEKESPSKSLLSSFHEDGGVLDLGDYALWQTGDQFRKNVGPSRVADTYARDGTF